MNISTFSIVVGTRSCDAACPFCISHSTGFEQVRDKDINWDAFSRAVAMARSAEDGPPTLLLTGKGEPTLYPTEITLYLEAIRNMSRIDVLDTDEGEVELVQSIFPTIELQTNGIRLGRLATDELEGSPELYKHLRLWRKLGLTTIALSTVGINPKHNKQVYLHHRQEPYPDLETTVRFLHDEGFQVRLCVMMQQGMVCTPEGVKEVVDWCREHQVEQLTVRPIRRPKNKLPVMQNEADRYVMQYGLDEAEETVIAEWIRKTGHHIYTFTAGEHEFKVYDINGQNVCLADCLTVSTKADTIRTLILYPRQKRGNIAYHWQFTSAVL